MSNAILAVQKIGDLINTLDEKERVMVIEWIIKQYNIEIGFHRTNSSSGTVVANGLEVDDKPNDITSYETLGELLNESRAGKGYERVLLAAAWLQKRNSLTELSGYQINKELNQTGYPQANITVAISHLMNQKPGLMTQTGKGKGTVKAKKKYLVTTEGFRKARALLTTDI